MLQTRTWLQSTRFRAIVFIVVALLLLQFLLAFKIYYNRIYIYNIAQIYILDGSNAILQLNDTSRLFSDRFINRSISIDTSPITAQDDVFTNESFPNDPCPVVPPDLTGPIPVSFKAPSFNDLETLFSNMSQGGTWRPMHCAPRHKIAVIIPYRDRDEQLRAFLNHMHKFLQKQQLHYAIFVIEQMANQTFNRGKLLNVGFTEATKIGNWHCVVLHDVDLLPEDDRNLYSCPDQPRHMSVAVDKFEYELPYKEIFGGVTALRTDQFKMLNGYSNDYWGWGAEDDDMAYRIQFLGYRIIRYPAHIARYKMMKHVSEKGNPRNDCRYNLMYKVYTRWKNDGLNNLTYEIISYDRNRLCTRILVDLLEETSRKRLQAEKICEQKFYYYFIIGAFGIFVVLLLVMIRRLMRVKQVAIIKG